MGYTSFWASYISHNLSIILRSSMFCNYYIVYTLFNIVRTFFKVHILILSESVDLVGWVTFFVDLVLLIVRLFESDYIWSIISLITHIIFYFFWVEYENLPSLNNSHKSPWTLPSLFYFLSSPMVLNFWISSINNTDGSYELIPEFYISHCIF